MLALYHLVGGLRQSYRNQVLFLLFGHDSGNPAAINGAFLPAHDVDCGRGPIFLDLQ